MSIHKSQGSEFPVVILPITSASRRMLERNPHLHSHYTRQKASLSYFRRITGLRLCYPAHRNCPKTYLIERFSDLLETVEEKQQTISETATQVTSEQPYILTEENWDSIPAMIGITDADPKEIFWKIVHKKTHQSRWDFCLLVLNENQRAN